VKALSTPQALPLLASPAAAGSEQASAKTSPEAGLVSIIAPAQPSAPAAQVEAALVDQAEAITAAPGRLAAPASGIRTSIRTTLRSLFSSRRQEGDLPDASSQSAVPAQTALKPAMKASAASQDVQPPSPSPVQTTRSRGFSRVATAVLIGALILALPATAFAAGVPALAAGTSLAWLSSIHPTASALAGVAGAVYGVVAAHRNSATPPSAGEILSAAVRYGLLSGAGTYFLLDLVKVPFLGLAAAGVNPLPAAVATAALGQSAFQGKFADPATSSADRIMSAFPAVASALGLSVGVGALLMSAGTAMLLSTLTVNAMAVTGVAAAIFAALFQPGRSSAAGPAAMAKGYVLQSLMSGLALAVTNPYLMVPFLALAAWGFWDVVSTAGGELLALLPDSIRKHWQPKA
jgi:hypothetical protein